MTVRNRDSYWSRQHWTYLAFAAAIAGVLVLVQACGRSPAQPGPFGSAIDLKTDCSGVRTSTDTCDRTTSRLIPPAAPELPCPTAAEVDEIRRQVPIRVNDDISAGDLACREADGSADLTGVENIVIQSLLFLRRMQFDRPLPWTSRSAYDWVRSTIPSGIVIVASGNSHACLRCPGPITIAYTQAPPMRPTVFDLVSLLIVHEARHAQGFPHTCGRDPSYFNQPVRDTSVAEMGGYGVQYSLAYWLGHYSSEAPEAREYYRTLAARWLGQGVFCCECGTQDRL